MILIVALHTLVTKLDGESLKMNLVLKFFLMFLRAEFWGEDKRVLNDEK